MKRDIDFRSRGSSVPPQWVFVMLALVGLILLLVSLLLDREQVPEVLVDLLKELGIVVLAVFAVSLLYELFVAQKYMEQFLEYLRSEVQRGESNAAVCALLGVTRIFPTRQRYEVEYPLEDLTTAFRSGSTLRIVARSLFLLMGKPAPLARAIQQGGTLELCAFDPRSSSSQAATMPDLEVSDIEAALARFKKDIADWIRSNKPSGVVQLRHHGITLFDSYVSLESPTHRFVVWDLSFGRDTTQKRIIMLDPAKPLAADLRKRYDQVWENSHTVFHYDGSTIIVDEL